MLFKCLILYDEYINEFKDNEDIVTVISKNINENEDISNYDIIFSINNLENYNLLNIPFYLIDTNNNNNNEFITKKIFIYYQVKFRYGKYYDLIKTQKYIKINYNSGLQHKICDNLIFVYYGGFNDRDKYFEDIFKQHNNKNINVKHIINLNLHDSITNSDFSCMVHNRDYNSINHVLFPIDNYFNLSVYGNDTIEFKNKYNKIIWRGSTTGADKKFRLNFIIKTFNLNENIDIGISHYCQDGMHLSNEIKDKYYKPRIEIVELYKYKFILCLEGNDWSSSFIWALNSFVCPLHTFPFTKENLIFGNNLKEWIHFVPINTDGSDLLEKYEWCLNNLDTCEKIAMNGYNYMKYYRDNNIMSEILKTVINLYPFIL